jgi:hypothetical protein
VLTALTLRCAPAVGAEVAVSRDVEIHGDDVAGQLVLPVSDMEGELARQGCRVFSRAYWSDTTPLRTLHVEVRCKEGGNDERLSLR